MITNHLSSTDLNPTTTHNSPTPQSSLSFKTLEKLGKNTPDKFSTDPAVVELSRSGRVDLLEHLVPRETLEVVARRSRALSTELITLLESAYNNSLQHLLCSNQNIDIDTRHRIILDQGSLEKVVRLIDTLGSVDDLKELITILWRAGVGGSPDEDLPAPALAGLATLGGQGEILAARHPNVTEEILEDLSASSSSEVRYLVASHPKAAESVLETLAKDSDEWVARAASKTLRRSAGDQFGKFESLLPRLLGQGASDPLIKPEVLRVLAFAPYEGVRASIARHPKTPIDVKADLFLSGEHLQPSDRAGVLRFLVDHPTRSVRLRVSLHPSSPDDAVKTLAYDRDPLVKSCIAGRRETTDDVLEQLFKDGDVRVRASIASRERAPLSILRELIDDEAEEVIQAIAENQNVPREILQELADRTLPLGVRKAIAGNRHASSDLLDDLSRDRAAIVRQIVANRHRTLGTTLTKLSSDRSKKVREVVAKNRNTPFSALEELANDPIPAVRSASRERLELLSL